MEIINQNLQLEFKNIKEKHQKLINNKNENLNFLIN